MRTAIFLFVISGFFIVALGLASAQVREGQTSDNVWRKYTNEVGKILRHPRKVNPHEKRIPDPWKWENIK